MEFEHQVLFDLALFFQQLQTTIAADAVRQMDDVVPFVQLQEAIDHASKPRRVRPVQVGPQKQLAAAN